MSTDSDPPTDDEQVRELVRDELANALEEADIDLDDLPQEKGTTRREVLKTAGLAGAAGLTGAAGMNSATDAVSAGTSSSGDWGTKDDPGDFFSEDHFAVDQASGGLTTPPTGYLNFGFESGTPRYLDASGAYRDLTPFTDGNDDGVYTLPNAGDGISVGTQNGAHYASQYSSVQAAIDAAGVDGTVVLDAAGGPYAPTTTWSWYDGQTIILHADVETSSVAEVFHFTGTEQTLVPNGHTVDGLDRVNGAGFGVRMDDTASDCHVEGTLRVKRVTNFGAFLTGEDCTIETLVGVDCGDYGNNSGTGDTLDISEGTGCHAETVISTTPARHAVTFGIGNNSVRAKECSVGTIISDSPGGSHFASESSVDGRVDTVIGSGAREAMNQTTPTDDYSGYPEIAFASSTPGPTEGLTIGRCVTKNPVGGTAAAVGYANGCKDNHIDSLESVNAANHAVTFGYGSNDASDNTIGHLVISGAGGAGIYYRNPPGCRAGTNGGVIENCTGEGAYVDDASGSGAPMGSYLGPVTVRNNCQGTTVSGQSAGVATLNGNVTKGFELNGTVFIDDQTTATQTIGVYTDKLANSFQLIGVDASDMSTPYSFADSTAQVAAANRPAV